MNWSPTFVGVVGGEGRLLFSKGYFDALATALRRCIPCAFISTLQDVAMPEILKIDFTSKEAKIAALELKLYRGDELTNHGAPCSLTVENRGMINHVFWDNMRKVNDALNGTPDHFPLRLPEVDTAMAAFNGAGSPGSSIFLSAAL